MYTVKCDGNWLYNKSLFIDLLNPVLELSASSAGSFSFTIEESHPLFNSIYLIVSRIKVFRNGKEIWEGRPTSVNRSFDSSLKEYECEGELSYLNDTITPLKNWNEDTKPSISSLVSIVLNNHNKQVVNDDRKFHTGYMISSADKIKDYRNMKFTSTFEYLNTIREDTKSVFRIRKVNNTRYLDMYKLEPPYKSYSGHASQKIEFGKNLLEFSSNYSLDNIATAVIPLGAEYSASDQINNIEETLSNNEPFVINYIAKYYNIRRIDGNYDEDDPNYRWIEKEKTTLEGIKTYLEECEKKKSYIGEGSVHINRLVKQYQNTSYNASGTLKYTNWSSVDSKLVQYYGYLDACKEYKQDSKSLMLNDYPAKLTDKIYVINSDAYATYGPIFKTVEYGETTSVGELKRQAQKYVNNIQYNDMELSITAFDFNLVDDGVVPFDLLDIADVTSKPHGIENMPMPIKGLNIDLEHPESSTVTLGRVDSSKKQLTADVGKSIREQNKKS